MSAIAIRVPSPAKLNLFLHITGRLENGYHELQTIFELIDLHDTLSFQCLNQDKIEVEGLNQVELSQNLIYRSAQALLPYRKIQQGCHISLEKIIPMGAGLGGGSSNAATTLLVLNKLWQCHLSQQQLIDIGSKLGADIPIFIYGHSAWAEGIGDIITPITELTAKRYIILKPDCFISTQALFSQKTLTRNTKPSTFAAYQQNPNLFGNNFEPLARQLYPEVDEALRYLNQYGQARLTGTGACVFVDIDEQSDVATILHHAPCTGYVANSLKHSPVLDIVQQL